MMYPWGIRAAEVYLSRKWHNTQSFDTFYRPGIKEEAGIEHHDSSSVSSSAGIFAFPLQAMKEKADAIKAANIRIFVRRGGPNYQAGLALMRKMGEDTGIHVEVFGPETSMTVICAKAIEYVKGQK